MTSGVSVSLAGIHAGCSFQSNSVDEEKKENGEQKTVRPHRERKRKVIQSALNSPCLSQSIIFLNAEALVQRSSLPLIILLICR